MLTNYHTHTTFCDGKNTPEEVVLHAIDKGFSAIGFSGHGSAPYCIYGMADTDGYIAEITRLREKYKDKIQIYCGTEEDAFCPVDRTRLDYIIGSCHYFYIDGKYYPIDSNYQRFSECVEAFGGDVLRLAETYYKFFADYIKTRKPDVVGHFDLITKFEEVDRMHFLNNERYYEIAEKYLREAAKSGVLFEINTGAMAKGIRKTPYLGERLLKVLKEEGAGVILSSDCHFIEALDFGFEEAKKLLRSVGFDGVYNLYDGEFKKSFI